MAILVNKNLSSFVPLRCLAKFFFLELYGFWEFDFNRIFLWKEVSFCL